MRTLLPPGWPRPKGYSNGVVVEAGKTVYLAGIVGWNEREQFEARDFAGQVRQALLNIVALLKEAGAEPAHLVRLTWFIGSKEEYLGCLKDIGAHWKAIIGPHYPPMAVIEVKGFIEDHAKLEIQATAVIPR